MPKKSKLSVQAVNCSSSPLSPINLTALRRCRPLLIKDLDVDELLRSPATVVDGGSASDSGGYRWIGPEVRSAVLSITDTERRAVALLDAVESSTTVSHGSGDVGRLDADAIFTAFVDSLRTGDRNRKLHAVLDETLRVLSGELNSDEDDIDVDDCGLFADRTSVPGDSVRKLIRHYATRQLNRQHQRVGVSGIRTSTATGSGSQTINGSDFGESEPKSKMPDPDIAGEDYVGCFTVATRGSRLQPEPWIKHAKASSDFNSGDSGDGTSPFDGTVVISKDTVFRRLDRGSLPTSVIIGLEVPPPSFDCVYVVDFDYKFVPLTANASATTVKSTTMASQPEVLPPPRLHTTTAAKTVGPTQSGGGGINTTGDAHERTVHIAADISPPDTAAVPPLPPKPRDLALGGVVSQPAARSAPRLPPLPADEDTTSINEPPLEAPPIPERRSKSVTTATTLCDSAVDDEASVVNPLPDVIKPSASPQLPTRRGTGGCAVFQAATPAGSTSVTDATSGDVEGESDVSSDSDSSSPPPPQLPPRSTTTGSRPPLPLPTASDPDDVDVGSGSPLKYGKPEINIVTADAEAIVALTFDANEASSEPVADETAQIAKGIESLPVRSVSVDETSSTSVSRPVSAISITPTSNSETTSLPDNDEIIDDSVMNRPISQREDSGIVVSTSTCSPSTPGLPDSPTESTSPLDVVVELHSSSTFSDDERTLTYSDTVERYVVDPTAATAAVAVAAAVDATVTESSWRTSDPVDDGLASYGSTTGGGSSGSGEAATSSVAGLDSGVDSLQSLPRHAYGNAAGVRQRRDGRQGDDYEDDEDASVCDEDDLSEIRIPAGEDCVDDDDLDRFSTESFSHYEDIELLPMENIYLDPRRPSDSTTSSLTAGRTPSSVKRRRNDPNTYGAGGEGNIVRNGYGRVSSSAASRRREEMLADLAATDRKLLTSGTTLILNPRDKDAPSIGSRSSIVNDRGSSDCDDQSTSSSSMRCFRDVRLAYDARCTAFFVPVELLRDHGDPTGERWFFPVAMMPRDATLFLRSENQPGCFVVYRPPAKGVSAAASDLPLYYLSVCLGNGGDVVHYRVVRNPRGDVSIAGHDHSFLNVADLVSYFRRNRSGLAVRLGRPLADAGRAATGETSWWSAATSRYALSRRDLVVTSRPVRHRPTSDDVEEGVGGRFGKTFVGRYRGRAVAVSVMGRSDVSDSNNGVGFRSSSLAERVDEFLEPALDVVSGLRHENVARLIGVSCSERPFYIAWEHSESGATLADRLRGGVDGSGGVGYLASDDVEALFDVCLQASSAVAYLESQRFVLHRDLAARSFIVIDGMEGGLGGGGRVVKLSNFERARRVNDDDYQAPLSETVFVRWAAPEVLAESRYSTKSDVWSLSVLFWEVFSSAAMPYPSLDSIEQVALYVVNSTRVNGHVCRPDRPTGPCPDDLWTVMRACWRHRATDRPTPSALYDRLRGGRSKIYAGISASGAAGDDVDSSNTPRRASADLRSTLASGLLGRGRRPMPLPLEPMTTSNGKSPFKRDSGIVGSPTSIVMDPHPSATSGDRPLSDPSTRENRWSGENGAKPRAMTPSTAASHLHFNRLPPSPSWDTTSMVSSATVGGNERGNTLRQSFMRLLPHTHRKNKKTSSSNTAGAGEYSVGKKQ